MICFIRANLFDLTLHTYYHGTFGKGLHFRTLLLIAQVVNIKSGISALKV